MSANNTGDQRHEDTIPGLFFKYTSYTAVKQIRQHIVCSSPVDVFVLLFPVAPGGHAHLTAFLKEKVPFMQNSELFIYIYIYIYIYLYLYYL